MSRCLVKKKVTYSCPKCGEAKEGLEDNKVICFPAYCICNCEFRVVIQPVKCIPCRDDLEGCKHAVIGEMED